MFELSRYVSLVQNYGLLNVAMIRLWINKSWEKKGPFEESDLSQVSPYCHTFEMNYKACQKARHNSCPWTSHGPIIRFREAIFTMKNIKTRYFNCLPDTELIWRQHAVWANGADFPESPNTALHYQLYSFLVPCERLLTTETSNISHSFTDMTTREYWRLTAGLTEWLTWLKEKPEDWLLDCMYDWLDFHRSQKTDCCFVWMTDLNTRETGRLTAGLTEWLTWLPEKPENCLLDWLNDLPDYQSLID